MKFFGFGKKKVDENLIDSSGKTPYDMPTIEKTPKGSVNTNMRKQMICDKTKETFKRLIAVGKIDENSIEQLDDLLANFKQMSNSDDLIATQNIDTLIMETLKFIEVQGNRGDSILINNYLSRLSELFDARSYPTAEYKNKQYLITDQKCFQIQLEFHTQETRKENLLKQMAFLKEKYRTAEGFQKDKIKTEVVTLNSRIEAMNRIIESLQKRVNFAFELKSMYTQKVVNNFSSFSVKEDEFDEFMNLLSENNIDEKQFDRCMSIINREKERSAPKKDIDVDISHDFANPDTKEKISDTEIENIFDKY